MRTGHGELDGWWPLGLATVGRIYLGCLRVRYAGLSRIPPGGPVIVAANHLSVLDPIAVALGAASRGRAIRFLAGSEFFEKPVWGPGLRLMKQIPVRRGIRDLAALEELSAVLSTGGMAGIFPEGGIGAGLPPLRGRSGVARVALAAGAPVLPVGIWGTQERWPRAGLRLSMPLRAPVAVAFGELLHLEPLPDRSPQKVREVTGQIMAAIEGLVAASKAAVERWSGRGIDAVPPGGAVPAFRSDQVGGVRVDPDR